MRKVLLAIGVEQYADRRMGAVEYAAADATEFARALGPYGFDAAESWILTDGQATKTAVQSRLRKRLTGLEAADLVYVYFAGHGFAHDQRNFLACHDTQLDDLVETSLSVAWLFDQFRASACRRIVLFLDACAGGLLAVPEVREQHTDLADDEFQAFFADSKLRICLAACRPGQVSRGHQSLRHGVWTHHLLQALRGQAPEALEQESFVTSASLQSFLTREVPRSVRTLFTGLDPQTPSFYGAASSDFLIADVSSILASQGKSADLSGKPLRHARLLNDEILPVRSLSGFAKGHIVPDRVNDAAEAFVSRIAAQDVEQEIDRLHDALRSSFRFKRRDIAASAEGASGSIVTPYFDYELTVRPNAANPAEAIFRRQVIHIRQPDQVISEEFDRIFQGRFDRLEFGSSEPVDLEQIVDQIEELESDAIRVSYDKDLTRCEIHVAGSPVRVEVTRDRFCLTQAGRQSPRALIQAFFEVQKVLVDQHGMKPLPFRPQDE